LDASLRAWSAAAGKPFPTVNLRSISGVALVRANTLVLRDRARQGLRDDGIAAHTIAAMLKPADYSLPARNQSPRDGARASSEKHDQICQAAG